MFGLSILFLKAAHGSNLELGDMLSSSGDKHDDVELVIMVKATRKVVWVVGYAGSGIRGCGNGYCGYGGGCG